MPIFLKIFFYSCLGPTWHSNQRFHGHTVRRLGLSRNNYNFRTEWSLQDGPSPIVKSGVLAVYHLHNAFNFVFVCLFTFFKERHHRLGIKISLLQWPKAYCCDHAYRYFSSSPCYYFWCIYGSCCIHIGKNR